MDWKIANRLWQVFACISLSALAVTLITAALAFVGWVREGPIPNLIVTVAALTWLISLLVGAVFFYIAWRPRKSV
jgi:anti-sigma-K factor RskA